MAIAAFYGTTVGFTELPGSHIQIERNDGAVIIISNETFKHLYLKLNDFVASLKENCIEYTCYQLGKPLDYYPEWFQQEVHWGRVYNNDGVNMFYDTCGEIAMSSTSIILRNYIGDIAYMEPGTFNKHYDSGLYL